jgi:SAM-dependent methyltransferase
MDRLQVQNAGKRDKKDTKVELSTKKRFSLEILQAIVHVFVATKTTFANRSSTMRVFFIILLASPFASAWLAPRNAVRSTQNSRRLITYALVPQPNPSADTHAVSQAGVIYSDAFACIQSVYPAAMLSQRNAVSRTDGYWPYLSQGIEPPRSLTYGEFDFYFFAELLDRALLLSARESWQDTVFCDVGSGTGRLVLAAHQLHAWKECRGVEILPQVHREAEHKLQECDGITLICGSFEDNDNLKNADCIFAFSSCFTPETMQSLGNAVGKQCNPGTIVITTDYMLPLEGPDYLLRLVEQRNGWCWLTGGPSTAFLHQVVQSSS